ncbi:MAG: immunoglobulin domain-containing protein [Limisphaerales bacterium]
MFLHFAPICKALPGSAALLGAPAAIVLRWAAAIATMLGAYHTVSAASAAIVGLTKYNNNTPSGTPTNNAVVMEGSVFRYRITVSNAGSDHNKDYFNCIPMPPGLTMNTNIGGNGFITNKVASALVPGVYPVRLYAGNTSFPNPVTYNATITILALETLPSISAHPLSQTVNAGEPVTFTVSATGGNLRYQWKFNAGIMNGETNSTLSISSATAAHAGEYSVIVSNSVRSITSNRAQLTVRPQLLSIVNPRVINGNFSFQATASGPGPYIVWAASDLTGWIPVTTNTPSAGIVQFSEPAGAAMRFYSLSTAP